MAHNAFGERHGPGNKPLEDMTRLPPPPCDRLCFRDGAGAAVEMIVPFCQSLSAIAGRLPAQTYSEEPADNYQCTPPPLPCPAAAAAAAAVEDRLRAPVTPPVAAGPSAPKIPVIYTSDTRA